MTVWMIFKIRSLIHHILNKIHKDNQINGSDNFVIKIVQNNNTDKMKVFLLNNK